MNTVNIIKVRNYVRLEARIFNLRTVCQKLRRSVSGHNVEAHMYVCASVWLCYTTTRYTTVSCNVT